MNSLANIRRAIAASFDDGIKDVCLRLVDEIERRRDEPDKLWTYQVFSSWLRPAPDEIVHECVDFLATARSARLLELHFLAFDPADPGDVGAQVADEEVKKAYATGVFYHPDSGEKVPDFEDWLVPYFTLNTDVHRARDSR